MPGRNRILAVLLLLCVAAPARAADDPAQIAKGKALLATLAGLRKADDATGFQGELKGIVSLHNELENKGMRGKLQKELGAVLKAKKMSDAYTAVVKALSELNDSKGAYKQLKRMMPSSKDEEVAEIHIEALRAVGVLAPDGALKALYELGEKAKHRPTGIAAIDALGHFGKSKKRAEVLEEMVKLLMRFMPAKGVNNGEETIKRWNDLAPPLIGGLNRMTGQKVTDPDEWIQLWRENKKKPDNLFMIE